MADLRDPRITITTDADTRGTDKAAKSLDRVGTSAKKAGKDLGGMSREAKKLDDQIERSQQRIRQLSKVIAETGDVTLFKILRKESGVLSGLKKARGALTPSVPSVPGGAGGGLFTQALGSPVVPAIVGAIVAGSPIIGATIGAALVAGIGGGVVAGGIVAAVQDADVKAAFKPVGAALKDTFVDGFGAAFRSPLMGSAKFFKDLVGDMRSTFVDIGKRMSVLVEPLTRGAGGLLKNLFGGEGFRKFLDQAGPVLKIFADELPNIGNALDDFFGSLSDPSAQEGMRFLIDFIKKAIVGTGNLIEFLSKAFDRITNLADATRYLAPALGPLWNMLGDANIPEKLDATGVAADNTFSIIDTGAADAAEAVAELNKQFDDAFDKTMDLDKASDGYREALLKVKDAVDDNGRSLSDHTLKGLANRDMIRGLIGDAAQLRDAEIASGNGTKEATDKANAAYRARLEEIRKVLILAGYEAQAVDTIIGKYRALAALPPIVKTVQVKYVTSGNPPPSSPRGTVLYYRQGGIQYAQQGMITNQPTVMFGERGTGREGFVPQFGISRQRAHSLMSEMGRWHGLDVQPTGQRTGGGTATRVLQPVILKLDSRTVYEALIDLATQQGQNPGDLWPNTR